MKCWIGVNQHVVELSCLDIIRLLLGRELHPHLPGSTVIRQRIAYEMFNLGATREKHS